MGWEGWRVADGAGVQKGNIKECISVDQINGTALASELSWRNHL